MVVVPAITLSPTLKNYLPFSSSQLLSASVSASSCPGNHLSSSAPQPCHRTRYCRPLPHIHSSSILLISHSCSLDLVTTGPGWARTWEGKRLVLLGLKQCSWDAWNVGNWLGSLGRSSDVRAWLVLKARAWAGL
jgi:hypothetical protein